MTFIEFTNTYPNEEAIINKMFKVRYGNGLKCPHCGEMERVSRRNDQPRLCNCNGCKNTFSVFSGTIFEKSTTNLTKWFFAINLFLNAKKGISACQLQREIGTTYKTAWRMLKQIRTAMGNHNLSKAFSLEVEVDETYIGGKPRKENLQTAAKTPLNANGRKQIGRGTSKTPVVGVRERKTGKVYATVAFPDESGKKLSGKQLLSVIEKVCTKGTTVMTDDFTGYNILNGSTEYKRITIRHSLGQFSAGKGLNTNGIEGFWAVLKRAVLGSYHHISVKYMQSHVNECCFHRNNCETDCAFEQLLRQGVLAA